jgi:hypothetical protein
MSLNIVFRKLEARLRGDPKWRPETCEGKQPQLTELDKAFALAAARLTSLRIKFELRRAELDPTTFAGLSDIDVFHFYRFVGDKARAPGHRNAAVIGSAFDVAYLGPSIPETTAFVLGYCLLERDVRAKVTDLGLPAGFLDVLAFLRYRRLLPASPTPALASREHLETVQAELRDASRTYDAQTRHGFCSVDEVRAAIRAGAAAWWRVSG